ncbi:Glutamyl-tRNA(Gln) amidotransferase subunit C, mitochondrial [Pseudolycoriella hygida]|uniref:Glutamyl-tRNA(Gln) amidotransferase subunit C, mitochondrial n=1 Tax=Pseudolycoriella hygida TaxID=35572 RepID=A0A9Q0MZC8_9DIPT|nr:Glutamyl-tRNA(Gln) amidotransferase subunit C, mitochondrial [Pseudolycoriella hygida]
MFRTANIREIIRCFRLKTVSGTTVTTTLQPNKSFCSCKSKDSTKKPLDFSELKFVSKVPSSPHVSPINLVKVDRIKIDEDTIQLLERLSLVNLDSKEAINTLEDSIEFASKILHIDTTNVEPLYTVLEYQNLYLRKDIVNEGNCSEAILSNAKVTEEGYFVAPPGNIPFQQTESIEKRKENRDD